MDQAILQRLPKVVLHDHLDGGLRPATVLELAREQGYEGLPESTVEGLSRWFFQAGSATLVHYLEAFAQTVAVMQTAASLERVAHEAVLDLAADGAVYAELRFAPMLHLAGGLSPERVVDAVLAGCAAGRRQTGIPVFVIACALRHLDDSAAVATLAGQFAHRGVVGFDLAGPEAGFPASRHRAACRAATQAGLRLTLHAGEGAGVDSMADALGCGAERFGHGVRLIEDLTVRDGRVVGMGPVAAQIHARGLALEVCPTSNLHTGTFPSIEAHPVGLLHRAGFAVTLSPDNRLMSGTSMTAEFAQVVAHHGFTVEDLQTVSRRAAEAAFCDGATRAEIRERVLAGYPAV
ncbi:MAG: adenosine deaminase [Acidimicrobiia bacterium]|jgi:adenosine deaminase|nr:adenosine deaminase [Acidimicrobiia bacterium]